MKLTKLKVTLAKQILESENEAELRSVDELLNARQLKLTAEQKAELDQDFADYKAGKGKNYTWAEVKAHARSLRAK
jgi:putative addiction module component (TIGR02574 family)